MLIFLLLAPMHFDLIEEYMILVMKGEPEKAVQLINGHFKIRMETYYQDMKKYRNGKKDA